MIYKTYSVVPEDTLSKIASKFYSNGSLYPRIFAANGLILSNPDEIYPGQTLRIPELHTVKSGDSLSQIANQYYGDSNLYPQIFAANPLLLSNPDEIYPGQVLRIPQLHTVQPGDALFKFAGKYYDNESLFKEIFEANTSILKNPDEIYPDQVLLIPDLYIIQQGDTLSKISKNCYGYDGLYMKIFEANRSILKNPNEIQPKQILRIPFL